ncbi:hypothetical protein LTR85_005446 [Meristemomyces frigidus]|nr:hypothetical protein LTR85_005446 [Meristemomyces frigidus]
MASASVPTRQAAGSAPTGECLLLKLPPELRNLIYELAFTTAADAGEPINIINGRHPSPSLVLTCSQMYSEALGIYKQLWTRYWATSKFVLDADLVKGGDKEQLVAKARIAVSGTELITKFTLLGGQLSSWTGQCHRKFVMRGRGWEVRRLNGDSYQSQVFLYLGARAVGPAVETSGPPTVLRMRLFTFDTREAMDAAMDAATEDARPTCFTDHIMELARQ